MFSHFETEWFKEQKGDEPAGRAIHERVLSLAKERWQAVCDHRHGKDPVDLTKRREEYRIRRNQKTLKEKTRKAKLESKRKAKQQETFNEYLKTARSSDQVTQEHHNQSPTTPQSHQPETNEPPNELRDKG